MTKASKKYKIDFVITWVDGEDPKWRNKRAKYSKDNDDVNEARYRNWNILKYWFRGVEQFAPWVNNIYFVTDHQIPNWLNVNHPKIKIVNHEDFIPKKYLPTFSSHPIELNLHRIKNLSEQFVYFNDDMFILNEVNEDYFFRDGIPRDSAILNINCERKDWQIQKINNNNIGIINSEFAFRDCIKKNIFKWFSPLYGKDVLRNFWLLPCPRFPGIKHYHLHGNYLKTTYELLWNKFFVDLDETSFHKFREPSLDVNQWLVKDWQIVSGNFVPQAPCGIFHDMKKRNDFECLIKDIVNAKSKILCINDAEDISMEEYEYKKKRLIESFERKFPHKSSFEKGVK